MEFHMQPDDIGFEARASRFYFTSKSPVPEGLKGSLLVTQETFSTMGDYECSGDVIRAITAEELPDYIKISR